MFSIITPTFNRAHTLDRVFQSLNEQVDKDFEWLIIDDASTDHTAELVQQWKQMHLPFDIKYHVLPQNKGKPNALNIGLNYCSRPITIIADSDDAFLPNTLSELRLLWNMVDLSNDACKIATIWTLVKDEQNRLVGEPFPHNFWQVNFKERVLDRKKMVAGEKWHSWRTSILKKYRMYHSEHSFVGERATWNRINKDYDFLCVNIIQRIYYTSPDGLIQKKKTRLEIEKLKFYLAYYQLYETSIRDIILHRYYHQYAYEYIKALLYINKRDLTLSTNKTFFCILLSFYHLPRRVLAYRSVYLKARRSRTFE